MSDNPRIHWPAWVLILDVIGTILVGFGIYVQVSSGPVPFAGSIDLRALAVPMIVLGALLVAPLVFMTVAQVRAQKR